MAESTFKILVAVTLLAAGCDNHAKLSVRTTRGSEASNTADATGKSAAAQAPIDMAKDPMPATFKELGLFADGSIDHPAARVFPYNVKVSLWSDGVNKGRYIYVPDGKTIGVNKDTGKLIFPAGTTLVKHFARDAANKQPLETRVITMQPDGTWGFATYQWTDASTTKRVSDAVIVKGSGTDADYRIPSNDDCHQCHTNGNFALGFTAAQLNFPLSGGSTQLAALIKAGLFDADAATRLSALPSMVDPADETLSLDTRARAYINLNCGVCHNPAGPAAFLDLSAAGLDEALLVHGRYVVPGKLDSSKIWMKFTAAEYRMPPQSTVQDPLGLKLLKAWIEQWPTTGEGGATDGSGTTTGSGAADGADSGTTTGSGGTTGSTDGSGTTTGPGNTTGGVDGGTGTTMGSGGSTDGADGGTTQAPGPSGTTDGDVDG